MDVYIDALGHVRVAKVGVSGKRRVENGTTRGGWNSRKPFQPEKVNGRGYFLVSRLPQIIVFLFGSFGVIFFFDEIRCIERRIGYIRW